MSTVKAGRTISRSTAGVLKECMDDMDELHKEHCATRAAKALCERCTGRMKGLLSLGVSPDEDDNPEPKGAAQVALPSPSVMDVESVFAGVFGMTSAQRSRLKEVLGIIDEAEASTQDLNQFRSLLG